MWVILCPNQYHGSKLEIEKQSQKNVEDTHTCLGPYHQFPRYSFFQEIFVTELIFFNSVPLVIESTERLTQSFLCKLIMDNKKTSYGISLLPLPYE